MTERERELCRSSYAAQLDSLGYGPDGTPKDKKTAWPDWISVKDRLPPNDPNVKVLTYGNPVVTHWMPLPEPPKEG